MTWSWSHTPQAYRDAEDNMRDLDDETIAVIYAEWRAAVPDEFGSYDLHLGRYEFALRGAESKIARGLREFLEDYIWERTCELARCTDGGWAAWLCPFGCGPHMVEFKREEPDHVQAQQSNPTPLV